MISRRLLCSFLLALFTALTISAQTRKLTTKQLPASAFKLIALKITGTDTYTEKDLLPTIGLELGQTVSEDDFKKAAQVLGETGMFSDVVYSYSYSPDGTKLELQLTENTKLLPVQFENFVWFSGEELHNQLRQRVPLFKDKLPISGELPDQVSDALQAVLLERKVVGHVDYLRASDRPDGPVTRFDYSVSGHDIHIDHFEFPGASEPELAALQTAADKIQREEFSASVIRSRAEGNLLPIYYEHGYLRAQFAPVQTKIIQDAPDATTVAVIMPMTPGKQYKIAGLDFQGEKAFPPDKLRALVHVAPGQIANGVQLASDIDAIRSLYGTKGYMEAKITPEPQIDDATTTVKYLLHVTEGDVYKMGDLDLRGLDSRTTAKLIDDWRLRGGDVYDSSYLKQFLKETASEYEPMGPWKISMHESVDNKDKTVDVTIRFDPAR